MANNQDPETSKNSRRAEAQAAMEGEERHVARVKKEADREKRRGEARRAMEGEELRKRRETREQLATHQAAERATQSQEVEAAAALAQKTEQDKTRKAAEEAEADEAAYEKRVGKIENSQAEIDRLKEERTMLSPIRTYKSDLARAVKEEGVSLSTIALSEQNRKRLGLGPQPTKSQDHPGRFNLVLIIVLLLAGLGVGTFYWWQTRAVTPNPSGPNIAQPTKSLIFADQEKKLELNTTAANTRASIQNASEDTSGKWTIENLIFTQNGTSASWSKVAQYFNLKLPDNLTRSLGESYMFGLYRVGTGDNSHRFLILKTSLGDKAFATLLGWEPTMPNQLLPLFYGASPRLANIAFRDKLVRNKDARILVDTENKTALLYALIDDETIAIVPDEETFGAILDRFANDNGI